MESPRSDAQGTVGGPKTKVEGSTRLTYTGFRGGLEHLKASLKIETRLIDERFASVMGECVI